MQGGRHHEGPVVVWKYPVMRGDRDVQLWTAIAPTAAMFPLPSNAVVCPLEGGGITTMSGSDYDGDEVAFTFDATLISYMAIPLQALEDRVDPAWKQLVKKRMACAGIAKSWQGERERGRLHDSCRLNALGKCAWHSVHALRGRSGTVHRRHGCQCHMQRCAQPGALHERVCGRRIRPTQEI